ncbi:hypothetical protein M409DRAFT_17237 [Zasmidium cellare ATCC 36951]|uniref:Uncharacterized protein n=1 Tax=Zasmidium cellare ATCC 36951 TaxID=1080233 RepID=A0A6A6D286_ZASCE|nr:uncharacterized protein M409DRAFT_17237 [Zasmidium cellare ATCC 36951]KAF2173295.1 hypothetical protein M409DRAFT_17237 [Zasmidium cellare ATCC 36951]
MQSTRSLASNMLRSQPAAAMLRTRAVPMLRNQATRGFRTSGLRMAKAPAEEQRAHTISQRLRTLKKIPPELIPLGVVLAAAIFAAVYSLGRKLAVDKTLRLYRQGPEKH